LKDFSYNMSLTSNENGPERKVKFKTASRDEEHSVIGSVIKQQERARDREFAEDIQKEDNSNLKLVNLQKKYANTTEEIRDYNAPPPSSATVSERSFTATNDATDGSKVSIEDSDSIVPKPRKLVTQQRRSTFSGEENAVESPKLRGTSTRRSTFSGRDSILAPVSEQSPLHYPADEMMYQPLSIEMNESNIPLDYQQHYSQQVSERNMPRSFRMSRNSLHISQPANRLEGLAELRTGRVEKYSGEHILTSDSSSNLRAREHIKEDALLTTDNVTALDSEPGSTDSLTYPKKDQSGYCINPMKANHQGNLLFPPMPGIKPMFVPDKNGKNLSVRDELLANLTSAWYWSGYYAGCQQRLSEE